MTCWSIVRDVATRFAGKRLLGYVTRGKGVAVHARSCPNVQNLLYESDRRISVEWARLVEENPGRKMTYPVKLSVFCDDRTGMLKELTAVISDDGTNIRGVDSKPTGDSEALVEFVLEAEDMRHLTRIVQRPAPRTRCPRRTARPQGLEPVRRTADLSTTLRSGRDDKGKRGYVPMLFVIAAKKDIGK